MKKKTRKKIYEDKDVKELGRKKYTKERGVNERI